MEQDLILMRSFVIPIIVKPRFLRKSGIAKAQKKAGRSAKDGNVIAYIHPGSKLGVLLEINCETQL